MSPPRRHLLKGLRIVLTYAGYHAEIRPDIVSNSAIMVRRSGKDSHFRAQAHIWRFGREQKFAAAISASGAVRGVRNRRPPSGLTPCTGSCAASAAPLAAGPLGAPDAALLVVLGAPLLETNVFQARWPCRHAAVAVAPRPRPMSRPGKWLRRCYRDDNVVISITCMFIPTGPRAAYNTLNFVRPCSADL